MKINVISNQSFKADKFRMPVKIIKRADKVPSGMKFWPHNYQVSGNFVREYSNPNAKELFEKAQNASTIEEKIKYLEEMGDYKIINVENEKVVENFLKNLDIVG